MKNNKLHLFILLTSLLSIMMSEKVLCVTRYMINRNFTCIGFVEITKEKLLAHGVDSDWAHQFHWKSKAIKPRSKNTSVTAMVTQYKTFDELIQYLKGRNVKDEESRAQLLEAIRSFPRVLVDRTGKLIIYKKVYRYYFSRTVREFGDFYSMKVLSAPYGWTEFTVEAYSEGKHNLPIVIKVSRWANDDLMTDPLCAKNREHYFETAGQGKYLLFDPLLMMGEDGFYEIIKENIQHRPAKCIGFIPGRIPLTVDASGQWKIGGDKNRQNQLRICHDGADIYKCEISGFYNKIDTETGHWHQLKKLYVNISEYSAAPKSLEYIHCPEDKWSLEGVITEVKRIAMSDQAFSLTNQHNTLNPDQPYRATTNITTQKPPQPTESQSPNPRQPQPLSATPRNHPHKPHSASSDNPAHYASQPRR